MKNIDFGSVWGIWYTQCILQVSDTSIRKEVYLRVYIDTRIPRIPRKNKPN